MNKKSLVTVGVVVFTLLTGCSGEKMTAAGLFEDVKAKTEEARSAEMSMLMDFKGGVTASGTTLAIGMKMEMDMDVTTDPLMTYSENSMTVDFLGQSQSTDFKMYMIQEGDKKVTYTEMEDGTWETAETTFEEKNIADYTVGDLTKMAESFVLAEETEKVNDVVCYKLTGNFNGSELNSILAGLKEGLESRDILGDIEAEDIQIPIEYYVSKEGHQPVLMKLDLKDFILETLDMSLKELMNDTDFTSEIENCIMEFNFKSFDSVDSITIPDEVKQ